MERLLRTIDQSLIQLNTRLTELENRSNQNQNTIMEEKSLPETEGLLGGKTVLSSESGGVQKITYVAFCDYCHSQLNGSLLICDSCGRKVCEKCAICFNGTNICPECFKTEYPLSRESYQILALLYENISDSDEIAGITGMEEADVRSAVNLLLDNGCIIREGVSVFSRIKITNKGMTALVVHGRLLSNDADIACFPGRPNVRGEKV